MNMEQKMTPDRLPDEEEPKRLTRVEQARLEALKSFGCEDFASVLQSAKKVSLKTKLNISKKNNEDKNRDPALKGARQKSRRRSKSLQQGRILTTTQRLTQAELAKIESLKSFQNNSLADVTNSSKRIVSKFLNKPPKKCNNKNEDMTKEAFKISSEPENVCETQAENDLGVKTSTNMIKITSDKVEFGLTAHLQELFDTNQKVLNQAKNLDSPF